MNGRVSMKYFTVSLVTLVLLLSFSSFSSAHKVNVFAYADGEAIQVECYFTRSQKVRFGKLAVTDLATGEKLLEGTTDEQGLFRFQPDPDFLKTGHGMNILLRAGEGHQSDWQIEPEELAALTPPGKSAQQPTQQSTQLAGDAQPAPAEQLAQLPAASRAMAAMDMEATELEALIGKIMDAKLAPIKQTLARQVDSGPALRDIIGGIGWIIGLLGLATYMKHKR
jgi:nickel transport protein